MHKLGQIESIGVLLDFLTNPDEYRQMIKDVRAAAEEYKELVEKKRGIKNIDKWRASEGVRLAKAEEAISAREKAVTKLLEDQTEKQVSIDKEIAEIRSKQTDKARELAVREKLVVDIEERASKLDKVKSEYQDTINKLNAERDEVKQLKAKLEKAFEGLS
jgi:chromosome segregation ATPase